MGNETISPADRNHRNAMRPFVPIASSDLRSALGDPRNATVAPVTRQFAATRDLLHVRCVRQDLIHEAHPETAQRAAALSTPEQRGLRALPQGVQDAQQPEQPQEHLSS